MSILGNIVFFIYSLALAVVTLYCLMQLLLLYHYEKFHRRKAKLKQAERLSGRADEWPYVTIQLPVFNEMYVAERLIDNIMQIDYPSERFEVQVLDDSTDETLHIIRRKVVEYRAKGFHIVQVQRRERKGFKAGALKAAMPLVKGDFIAIFDADFLPKPDFLKKTLVYFQDKKVGAVQTRWEHLNEDYSLITRLQALQLNVHFRIEQQGRQAGNYLLQFNGTAGIWRRQAIEDAGGWEADTLTEDLDLSMRAQLRGWRIVYLEEVGSPAELPSEMNGLKSQQFRWMKGGAETARKMLPAVWRSSLSLEQKLLASMQLCAGSIYIFVFLMGVFSIPLLFFLHTRELKGSPLGWAILGMLSIVAVYYVANVRAPSKEGGYLRLLIRFTALFPLFLSLSMGLSLHNTVAVIQGWFRRQSTFIRTPKFNIRSLQDSFRQRSYLASKMTWTTATEGLMAACFLAATFFGINTGNYSFVALHGLMAFGFGATFYYSVVHLKKM